MTILDEKYEWCTENCEGKYELVHFRRNMHGYSDMYTFKEQFNAIAQVRLAPRRYLIFELESDAVKYRLVWPK
jgi:hypothetical protein